jgi:hypothetical protein
MINFGITIFGPERFLWRSWYAGSDGLWIRDNVLAWFGKPDEYSSGGMGFAVRSLRLKRGIQFYFHWHR